MVTALDADDNQIFVECDKQIRCTVDMHIRHGSSLALRNVKWYVTKKPISEPLLGRPTLEALGLDVKATLLAACERFDGEVDVSKLLQAREYPAGTVARVLYDGVFHSDRGCQEVEKDLEEDFFLDMGEDSDGEVEAAIQARLKEAAENGISATGLDTLSFLLREFRDIMCLVLGNDPPAKLEPMRVQLKPGARPVIARGRRYGGEQ